nr:transporter substrate-binding domain-containing protein [Escherichia coli]
MKLAHLGRQALMSVMAVALVAGMSVKSFADEGLLNKDTLAVTGEAFSRQESGVALRKGNEDLLKAVNDAIAEMQKDGTLQALSEKWFGADVTK